MCGKHQRVYGSQYLQAAGRLRCSFGASFEVVTMCLMQTEKAADREIEMMERRKNNEFRTELIQLVFIQCTELGAYGNRCYRSVSRLQA